MKTWIYTGVLSALLWLVIVSCVSAQCPGGVCQRPVKSVVAKSVTVTKQVVQKTATVKQRLTVRKFRLFQRWR
jgi:hypothetical protein